MNPTANWDKNQIKWIFWGLIFIHLHLNINGVDLLPDFVGFALFYIALDKLTPDSARYNSIKVLALLLAVVELYNLVKLIIGGTVIYGQVWTVSFVFALLFAMLDYMLFGVLVEVSEDCASVARTVALAKLRKLRLGFNLFSAVAGVLGAKLRVIAVVIVLLGLIVMVCSCVEVYRLWKEPTRERDAMKEDIGELR